MSDYGHVAVGRVSMQGGVAVATVVNNAARGTAQPCREVYIQAAISNADRISVALSSAVTSQKGLIVPQACATGISSVQGLRSQVLTMPVDNLNRLWFWGGADDDTVVLVFRQ